MPINIIVYNLLLFGSRGYALVRGTSEARIVAVTMVVGTFITIPVMSDYRHVERGVMLVDTLVLLPFGYAALRSDRFWALWVCGLELTTVFGHVIKALDLSTLLLVYAVASRMWVYPQLVVLGAAVWRARMRLYRACHGLPAIP